MNSVIDAIRCALAFDENSIFHFDRLLLDTQDACEQKGKRNKKQRTYT